MKFLVALFLLFLSFTTFAKTYFFADQKGDHYLVSFESEGKWYLDHFVVPKGELQDHLGRFSFDNEKDLNEFVGERFPLTARKTSFLKRRQSYVTTEVQEKVWEVKAEWNEEWEIKFSNWMVENFNKDFFVKYNLETDCADVAFSLRWIFARIHGLPVANTLSGSHIIFSQDSFKAEWKNLNRHKDWFKDEVFLAALKYLLKGAYTGTLLIDGYPITITPETFLVGTIHLQGGHTMIISKIDPEGTSGAPLWKLSSTLPPQVRVLAEEIMMDGTATPEENGGFFRMRWPVKVNGKWSLIPKEEMPHFSREQYSDEFTEETGHFTLSVVKKLGIDFQPRKVVLKSIESILQGLKDRVKIVEEGFTICQTENCAEGTLNYEDHGTPSRDKRLGERFLSAMEAANLLEGIEPGLSAFFMDELKKATFTVLGVTKSLDEYRGIFYHHLYSFDPSDSLEERWGISTEAISSLLTKKASKLFAKRESLLKAGEICVGSDQCSPGSDLWQKYNSYELDNELKQNVFISLDFVCSRYQLCGVDNEVLAQKIQSIPFFVSDPSYNSYYRNGLHIKKWFILPFGVYYQLKDSLFVINNGLYDIAKSKEPFLYFSKSIYSKEHEVLVYLNDHKLGMYSLRNEMFAEISLQKNVTQLAWVADKTFLVTDCPSIQEGGWQNGRDQSCLVQVWKIENESFQLLSEYMTHFPYTSWPKFYDDEKDAVYLLVEKASAELAPVILFEDHKTKKFVELFHDKISQVYGRTPYGLLVGLESDKLGLVEDEKLRCTFRANRSEMGTFGGITDVIVMQAEDRGAFYRLDEKCGLKKIVEGEGFPWSSRFGASEYFTFNSFYGNKVFLLRDGDLKSIQIPSQQQIIKYGEEELLFSRLSVDYEAFSFYRLNVLTNEKKEVSLSEIPFACSSTPFCVDSIAEVSIFSADQKNYYLVKRNGIPFASFYAKRENAISDLFENSIHEGTVLKLNEQLQFYIPESGTK